MNKCQAITARGLPCGKKKRTEEGCGIHKHTALATSIDHLRRRIEVILDLDINYRTRGIRHPVGWIPVSVTEGLNYIQLLENLVRVDYPTWAGPITVGSAQEVRGHNPDILKVNEAVGRIPINLRHQAPLLHDWIKHFRHLVTTRYHVRAIEDLNWGIYKFYDPVRVQTAIRDGLVAVWNLLHITQKQELHRCFNNLMILGQTAYGNLRNDLPLPAAAPVVANDFINDKQNVHRRETVSYIENAFKLLKSMKIPEDQRTLGEILVNCRMKPEAEIQMVKFYHSGESIYEHKNAYKRSLDAVWSCVRKHENKTELYARVADEMNDNIGMCAQGNLSRICNILCGYLEEFKPPVPQGILVQNAIAAIAMDSEGNKVGRATSALKELLVPESEWSVWLEALEE